MCVAGRSNASIFPFPHCVGRQGAFVYEEAESFTCLGGDAAPRPFASCATFMDASKHGRWSLLYYLSCLQRLRCLCHVVDGDIGCLIDKYGQCQVSVADQARCSRLWVTRHERTELLYRIINIYGIPRECRQKGPGLKHGGEEHRKPALNSYRLIWNGALPDDECLGHQSI